MRGFVANVDRWWHATLRSLDPPNEEVNLWRPGSERFRALKPGEPVFLKLKAPDNAIAGFGFFTHFSLLPLSFAWDLAGAANGVASRNEMVEKLGAMRSRSGSSDASRNDPRIGSIFIARAVLFGDDEWVEVPADFASTVGHGKVYDIGRGHGRRIWHECLARSERRWSASAIRDGAGARTIALPRLGPLSFQVAVLDAWARRCAITGEGVITALAAARIREYGDARDDSVDNGILLRADLRALFEAGYITITKDLRVRVSRLAADERSGVSSYLELDGRTIRVPLRRAHRPSIEALFWHGEERFLGSGSNR